MKYTIGLNRVNSETSKVKAYANVCFDERFTVRDIAVYEGKNGLFATMPSYKTGKVDEHNNPEYKAYFLPITKEFHQELCGNIVGMYEAAVEQKKGEVTISFNEDAPEMEIEVSVHALENAGKKKALATLTMDGCFVVKNLSVMEGSKGLFMSMPQCPSINTETGEKAYKDLCIPMTKESYKEISNMVLDGYADISKQKGAVEAPAPKKAEQKETEKKKQSPKPSRVK